MNKFVLGALALTATSAPSLAGSGTDEWLKLDKDIESLASSLAPQGPSATVGGFVRTSYASSSDVGILIDANGNGMADPGEILNDLGGFSLDNARLFVSGSVGNFGLYISVDGANSLDPLLGAALPDHVTGNVQMAGPVGVVDAYATFEITPEISGMAGQFRRPFLAASLRDEDTLLFIDRSFLSHLFANRDTGAQVSGTFGQIQAALAAQNGADSAGDELAVSGRVQFTAMGTAPTVEGAYGATGNPNLTIGLGYFDDGTISDATAIGGDVQFATGAFSASGEIVDFDDGLGDFTPWNAVVGFMFVPNQWEVAIRYEDADDGFDTTAITGGINWYQAGHAAKVQLNYSTVDSDLPGSDFDLVQIGLTASI